MIPDMRSLINVITEGRDASLYHATGASQALSIIKEDVLRGMTEITLHGGEDVRGVSLTRSFNFAKNWRQSSIAFEFDQAKIAQTKRILPIDYWHDQPEAAGGSRRQAHLSEAEELVVGDIASMSRYLKAIHIRFRTVRELEDNETTDFGPLINHPRIKVRGGRVGSREL